MYFNNLPEEFLILIIDDESGKFSIKNDSFIEIGLAGAFLLELTLRGSIAQQADKIIIVDDSDLEDPLLQEILEMIINEEEIKSALYWVREIIEKKPKLKENILSRLEKEKIIEKEEKTIFWFFKTEKYNILKKNIEKTIKQEIHDIVMIKEKSDPRALAFLSLVYATNCTREIFSEKELEENLHIIRSLVTGDEIGNSVTQTIRSIIDALMRNYIVSFPHPY